MDPPNCESRATTASKSHISPASFQPLSTPPSTEGSGVMSKQKAKPDEDGVLQLEDDVRPDDVLGQFSYAPATQTTVVTTTTTTTTKFPPLRLRTPHHLHNLDPELYPLAGSPTPNSIKKLCFDVEGRPTVFQEADDTLRTLEKIKKQKKALSKSNGSLRSVTCSKPTFPAAGSDSTELDSQDAQSYRRNPGTVLKSGMKRPASSVSIAEAATLAGQQGSRKKRLVSSDRKRLGNANPGPSAQKPSHSKLQLMQTSTPITPQVETDDVPGSSRGWRSKILRERLPDETVSSIASSTLDARGELQDDHQILSPKSEANRSMSVHDEDLGDLDDDNVGGAHSQSMWSDHSRGPAMARLLEDDADMIHIGHPARGHRPRPSALDTTAATDASLPSPSLSPVTAAANLQTRREYFEQPRAISGRENDSSDRLLPNQNQGSTIGRTLIPSPSNSRDATMLDLESQNIDFQDDQSPRRSMMSMPAMVDTFEAMPEEMKNYVMYQLLRRCSKPVLHFVADVVNPALKCDFLSMLPVELCVTIMGSLDVKSLCSAAQVSKRWRELVDSSEKVWKRLFDADNYIFEEGELPRAIREGWGWQYPSRPDEFEEDLSYNALYSDTDAVRLPILATPPGVDLPPIKRARRKAKSKSKPISRKQQKKMQASSALSIDLDEETLLGMTSAAEGPYAAASAAALAIPYSRVGLPSLKNLHLFKSIYMRHHIIRNTWMEDEMAPRHLAFRAHQRHVVTCLQFDSEKILTGSDDAKINVYDTQTGALRAELEGHEGGVWALQYEGNILVSGSTDRSVRVWDVERGVCTQTFQGHTSTVRCLQILMPTEVGKRLDGRPIVMPKQPLIITGSRDSNLRVWKLPKSGDPMFHQSGPAPDESAECPYFVRALTGHHHSVRAIAAHADTLVSGSYDCSVRVWKISTGETIHRLQGHAQKVYSVVLDHKRNRCISGSMDNLVKVWSLDTGTALFNLEGHSSLVGLLDLQQDRLVSAAADSTLRIWDPENGHCKSILSAHTGAITCFQHDGQKVISGSDRTLKMWDVANGEFSKDLLTDLSGVWQVKFNERRCVAAVQRNNMTYIEVLDFGAGRDGVPPSKRGRRIVVNQEGEETFDPHDTSADAEIVVDD